MDRPDRRPATGLLPEQIAALNAPIYYRAVNMLPAQAGGYRYVPGVVVVGHLNRIFGFDGWSTEIVEMAEERFAEESGGGGVAQFRVIFTCRIVLTVRMPDGREIVRAGVGADEKKSRYLIDCYTNGQASALTAALKNAAITLGPQFGLDAMRMRDDDNRPADIHDVAAGEDPPWPDWEAVAASGRGVVPAADVAGMAAGFVGRDDRPRTEAGESYDPETGIVDEPQAASAVPPSPRTSRLEPEPEPESELPSRPESVPKSPPHSAPEAHAERPAPPPASGTADSRDRRAQAVAACRESWGRICAAMGRDRGKGIGGEIFAHAAGEFGFRGNLADIGKPADAGGPPDAMLVWLRNGLAEEAESAEGAAS